MSHMYKKILIVNTFGIGDVLFSTVLVRNLKEKFPDASIDFVCNRRGQHILKNNRHLDEIVVFEKDDYRELFRKSNIDFVKKLIEFLYDLKKKKYDLAIDLSLGYQVSLILMILGIKRRIGFNFRNRGRFLTDRLYIDGFSNKHAIEYYLDILGLLGISDFPDRSLEFELSSEVEEWADDFIAKNDLQGRLLVAIVPGGGKSWGKDAVYRRWEPENFGYIAKKLTKERENLTLLIMGSYEEKEICDVVERGAGNERVINVCGELSLPQSAALIKRSSILLCNEGGILHVAVSQGTRTVSIFGPVDDKAYGPYPVSEKNKVIIAASVECRPCYKNFRHNPCEMHLCLKGIDRDKVFKIIEERLA